MAWSAIFNTFSCIFHGATWWCLFEKGQRYCWGNQELVVYCLDACWVLMHIWWTSTLSGACPAAFITCGCTWSGSSLHDPVSCKANPSPAWCMYVCIVCWTLWVNQISISCTCLGNRDSPDRWLVLFWVCMPVGVQVLVHFHLLLCVLEQLTCYATHKIAPRGLGQRANWCSRLSG